MINYILSPEMIHALGWTLIHAVWQGALFALLLAVILVLLNKYSSRARYIVSVGLMLGFFLTTVITFFQLYNSPQLPNYQNIEYGYDYKNDHQKKQTNEFGEIENWEKSIVTPHQQSATSTPSLRQSFIQYYNQHLPLIITIWFIGVLILQLKFLGQLAYIQRLRSYGAKAIPSELLDKIKELEEIFKIKKKVDYLSSTKISSPLTFGWLKPVILFPELLLDELKETQIYAILAHELAHVKRNDFIVNCLQVLLGTLFFYHPGVWWMSARIEEEREHACDDLVLELTKQPTTYAKTLVEIQEHALSHTPMAMAFTGTSKNQFKYRITRLFSNPLANGTFIEGMVTASILIFGIGIGMISSGQTAVERDYSNDNISSQLDKEDRRADQAFWEEISNQEETEYDNFPGKSKRNFELLLHSIKDGNIQEVKKLIRLNTDINQTTTAGITPLMTAASENRPKIAWNLIRNGANVNFINKNGWTALMEAADEGTHATAEILIQNGADTNLFHPPNGPTAIDIAASKGHYDVFHLLLTQNAKINNTENGRSSLIAAANEGHLDIVSALIDKLADLDVQDKNGRTALNHAANEGQYEIVHLLLNAGAKVDIRDFRRRTALIHAANEGHTDIVANLLKHNANLNVQDIDGRTALNHAANEGNTRIVELLIRAGADVNLKDNSGRTPLMHAANEGQTAIVRRFILNEKTDLNQVDYGGSHALFHAIKEGNIKIAQLLINAGNDINLTNRGGKTPLIYAAEKGELGLVKFLIRNGADPNFHNPFNGKTALDYANKNNRQQIGSFLKKYTTKSTQHTDYHPSDEDQELFIIIPANANKNEINDVIKVARQYGVKISFNNIDFYKDKLQGIQLSAAYKNKPVATFTKRVAPPETLTEPILIYFKENQPTIVYGIPDDLGWVHQHLKDNERYKKLLKNK